MTGLNQRVFDGVALEDSDEPADVGFAVGVWTSVLFIIS